MRKLVDHNPNRFNEGLDHPGCDDIDSSVSYNAFTRDDFYLYKEWKRYKQVNYGLNHPDFNIDMYVAFEQYNWDEVFARYDEYGEYIDTDQGPDVEYYDVHSALNLSDLQNQNEEGNRYLSRLKNVNHTVCMEGMAAFYDQLVKSTNGETTNLG